MTGENPVSADDRTAALLQDEVDSYVSVRKNASRYYSESLLKTVDVALQFKAKDRPQTVRELQQLLMGNNGTLKSSKGQEGKAQVDSPEAGPATKLESTSDSKHKQNSFWEKNYIWVILVLLIVGGFVYVQVEEPKSVPKNIQEELITDRPLHIESHVSEQTDIVQDDISIAECDRLAADEYDPQRVAVAVGFRDFNADLALSSCKKAITLEPNNPRLQLQYARSLEGSSQGNKAIKWRRKAAEGGSTRAQFLLGIAYSEGSHGLQENHAEAITWIRMAAEQGNLVAQNEMGLEYSSLGSGLLPQNVAKSVKWYLRAANNGDITAQKNLAFMYAEGLDVSKNIIESKKWYRKAADQGDEDARKRLEQLINQ